MSAGGQIQKTLTVLKANCTQLDSLAKGGNNKPAVKDAGSALGFQ